MERTLMPYTERNAQLLIARAWSGAQMTDAVKGTLNPAQITYHAREAFFELFGLRDHFRMEFAEPQDNDASPFDISIPVLQAVGYAPSELSLPRSISKLRIGSDPVVYNSPIQDASLPALLIPASAERNSGLVNKIHALFRPARQDIKIEGAKNGVQKRTASSAFVTPPIMLEDGEVPESSSESVHRDKRIKREPSVGILDSVPQFQKDNTSARLQLPSPPLPRKLWPASSYFTPVSGHDVDDLVVSKEFSQTLLASRSIVLNVTLVRYIYFDPIDTVDNQRKIWLTGPKETIEAAKISFLTLLEQMKCEQRVKYDEYLRREERFRHEDEDRYDRRREPERERYIKREEHNWTGNWPRRDGRDVGRR